MPIFKDNKRITSIYEQGKSISQIHYNNKLIWQKKFSFSSSSWTEIKNKINDGTWSEQGWKLGDTHSLYLKNGQKMKVRIIGINDGHEEADNFAFQIDKTPEGEKVHLTLELIDCLPDAQILFNGNLDNESQTYSDSLLFTKLQPSGDLFEQLPDEVKSLIIPVIKYSGITGQSKNSSPAKSTNYLFIPSIIEYVGQNNYEINTQEGLIYEFYSYNPQLVQKKIIGQNENTYYWTRSASQVQDNVKDYFWSIASQNNYAMYPSNTELPIVYAFCI